MALVIVLALEQYRATTSPTMASSLSPVEAFVQLRPFAGCGYHSTVQGTTVLLVYELRLPSGISLLTKPLRQLLQLQYHCVDYYSAEGRSTTAIRLPARSRRTCNLRDYQWWVRFHLQ